MPSPRLAVLEHADRDLIHERTLDVLRHVGVRFPSAAARAVLSEAGCELEESSSLVRIPAELVAWALDQVPRDVLLAGRDPAQDALLDGSRTFATVAGICPFVVDIDTGRYREPGLADLEMVTRVADALDAYGIVWYSVSPTAEVPAAIVDLAAEACMLQNTGKHVMGQVLRPGEVPYALEIARLCGDSRDGATHPVFSAIYCPVAPLQHDGPAIEAAMALATRRVPIDIFSLGLSGATAPVSLAGTMLQTNCEVLSAVVLLQLAAPGCPLIYSANAAVMDMTTSRIAVSSPETLLMNVAQTELVHSYGMPALSVGYVPDSSELGFRAGVEDVALALLTRLGRPDIMTGLGTLESGQAVSLPKMLLDAEIVSYIEHVAGGFAVDDDHLSRDSIARVGPGGQYLSLKETRTRVRAGEHWQPHLLRRASYADVRRGVPGEVTRAREAVMELLATHRPPEVGAGVAEDVAAVLDLAEAELTRQV
jgi:trimethylamine---corrinoid protein Co-methyltransferase